jgi:hypothetical protein
VGTSTGFRGEIARLKPPQCQLGNRDGALHVTLEVVFEVKAEAEAKFHMY